MSICTSVRRLLGIETGEERVLRLLRSSNRDELYSYFDAMPETFSFSLKFLVKEAKIIKDVCVEACKVAENRWRVDKTMIVTAFSDLKHKKVESKSRYIDDSIEMPLLQLIHSILSDSFEYIDFRYLAAESISYDEDDELQDVS